MQFSNTGSTITATTWEGMSFELTSDLQTLEQALNLDNVGIEPDIDEQECSLSLSIPLSVSIGDGVTLTPANYVNDATFDKGTSDMTATTMVTAVVAAWTALQIAIEKGQQLSAYSCTVEISININDKVLEISVSRFPCTITSTGTGLQISPIEFLSGTATLTA